MPLLNQGDERPPPYIYVWNTRRKTMMSKHTYAIYYAAHGLHRQPRPPPPPHPLYKKRRRPALA